MLSRVVSVFLTPSMRILVKAIIAIGACKGAGGESRCSLVR